MVLVQCLKERSLSGSGSIPLPAAVILFAVLFDASIALGRVSFGLAQSLAPRYTMANLLLLVGIAIHVIHRLDLQNQPAHAKQAGHRPIRVAALGLMILFLLLQIGWGIRFGIDNGSVTAKSRTIGARTVVNLKRMPLARAESNISAYVYPNLQALEPLAKAAEHDDLNVFFPAIKAGYQAQGPPPGP